MIKNHFPLDNESCNYQNTNNKSMKRIFCAKIHKFFLKNIVCMNKEEKKLFGTAEWHPPFGKKLMVRGVLAARGTRLRPDWGTLGLCSKRASSSWKCIIHKSRLVLWSKGVLHQKANLEDWQDWFKIVESSPFGDEYWRHLIKSTLLSGLSLAI